ncbi:hypothetical protein PF001_g22017 [Phytophthora fragariae]|nr:hypothetical protein PF003_g7628 [Phytophthora fragariae]KAE9285209.1 hypothetical protein PF001_g22017 [Phytophthora fragariae]
MAFCKLRGINPPTLQTWERKLMKLVEVSSRQGTTTPSRASRLIVAGSGRVSPSTPIEDALVTFVKDARREEQIVTRDMIVRKATDLLPDVMESKSYDAQMSWCERFMRRRGLTMRRISQSGRKTRSDLKEARPGFVTDVLKIAMEDCFDPRLGLAPKRTIFNMDQTSVYYNMSSRSTVDFVSATCIPAATGGAESYRCTMAHTVAADGGKFPPHFVFQGQPGGDVGEGVQGLLRVVRSDILGPGQSVVRPAGHAGLNGECLEGYCDRAFCPYSR